MNLTLVCRPEFLSPHPVMKRQWLISQVLRKLIQFLPYAEVLFFAESHKKAPIEPFSCSLEESCVFCHVLRSCFAGSHKKAPNAPLLYELFCSLRTSVSAGLLLNCINSGLYMANYNLVIPTITRLCAHLNVSNSVVGLVIGCCDVATIPGTIGGFLNSFLSCSLLDTEAPWLGCQPFQNTTQPFHSPASQLSKKLLFVYYGCSVRTVYDLRASI